MAVIKQTSTNAKSNIEALIESSVFRSVSFCCFLIPTFVLTLTDPSAPFLQYSFLIEMGLVTFLTYYETDLIRWLINPFGLKKL
ncbi:hypothetical protein BC833DRAFT_610205 [Globomyces pollinis-pini]|nr:hypothetical protein BC833DRAFT_610205 [Globomyces pollinis-pini]